MEVLGDVGLVKSHFGLFGAVLASMQYSCTLCVKRTIGMEIGLDVPDGTPR